MIDSVPGISRVRAGKGFRYLYANGHAVRDIRTLQRIYDLVIPPAWTEVWICPEASGHLQATGRDARGRKQYRYHQRWREGRDAAKYGRLTIFGHALPRIRSRVRSDLRRRGLPREKVLAAVVRLLETSLVRVGNEEYVRQNGSFGLTTMKQHHAHVRGRTLRFDFRGKGGIRHVMDIRDNRLARLIRRCQELPGQQLFQYVDEDDEVRDVTSTDVNQYLRQISGDDFTAKDFRTWVATVLCAGALQQVKAAASKAQAKRNVVRVVGQVAKRLGNTKTICRKCYIHPAVIDAYLDGSLLPLLSASGAGRGKTKMKSRALRPDETALMAFLHGKDRSFRAAG
jgi:DNA topoisomerase-1